MARTRLAFAAVAAAVATLFAVVLAGAPGASVDASAAREVGPVDAAVRPVPGSPAATTSQGDVPEQPPPSDVAYAGSTSARRHVQPPPRSRAPVATSTHRAGPPFEPAVADGDVDAYATRLADTRGYVPLLQRLGALAGHDRSARFRDPESRRTGTRFAREPERSGRVLEEAALAAQDGCTRQALIFHLALALPRTESAPRLARIAAAGDADDAEDVLAASAFTGDADATGRYEALAATPSDACRALVLNAEADLARLEVAGRRDILRSYRCIEALDRAPYFHIHAAWLDYAEGTFPWAAPRDGDDRLSERLLAAWLRRYPGHPGSDDMAWRLACSTREAGRTRDALRWASFGATQPDGDMRNACARLIVSLVELAPEGDPVAEDVIDPAAPERNRDLLLYLRLRRHAQRLGFEFACRELENLAACEPDSLLARAWRERLAARPPRGLDSGRVPIAADDALRRRAAAPDVPEPQVRYIDMWRWQDDVPAAPLQPFRLERLRRQFRTWETLAELDARAWRAGGERAADLGYAAAAVLYHEPDVLYPVYATHDEARSGRPEAWRAPADPDANAAQARDVAWLRSVLSRELAAVRFEALARDEPYHALADDALYSAALAHVKAADERAVCAAGSEERERHIRLAVADFEELVTAYPRSALAAPAGAAARYWRRERADLFR